MTDHPCNGMTKVQIAAFERIAISQPPMAPMKTIVLLLKRGVIEQDGEEIIGRDRFGPIAVPRFYVPLPIHAQWCEWCSEQPGMGDL